MSIFQKEFGQMPDGRKVTAYTMTNKSGASVTMLDLGGILNRICVPDRTGRMDDVICGFDTVEGYLTGGGYQGAMIGRYANRIAGGKFSIDGKTYTLSCNEKGKVHIHGGDQGFHCKLWQVDSLYEREDSDQITIHYVSADGEEGYPGELRVTITYTFGDDGTLSLQYEAVTDQKTIVNLTNHSYFNLRGYAGGDIAGHRLWLDSDYITEVNDDLLPTGRNLPVKDTKFDFHVFKPLEECYDHNFVLKSQGTMKKAAELQEPTVGRAVEVWTEMPSVQIYTANFMNGSVPFKDGVPQRPHHAVCMETQFAPDSPNQPGFPSCVLCPGDRYHYTTEFRFKTL